jgi:hypothetical protein
MGNGPHFDPTFLGPDWPAIAHIRRACVTYAYVEDKSGSREPNR